MTMCTLGVTTIGTLTRLVGAGVMHALWRDPDRLRAGELWRLVTPVLVQSDHSAVVIVELFVLCAVVGAIGERVLSRPQWITLYLAGALAGHALGEAFQPHQSGTSVAFAGVLGGLAAYALQRDTRHPTPVRIEAAIAIPLAVLDTALRDIHGAPFLVGLVIAFVWFRRDARVSGLTQAGD
jgi:membrane associated rhomboid family serine protease